jgi:dihydrodipicolinate synthase/N-acetylneuraminate lyase
MAKSKQVPPPSGVYAALATPRRPETVEADVAALLDYIDAVVHSGVDGLVLFGSTGEFVHFDVAERVRALSLAVKRSRVPVLVNVSHPALAGAIELAENAIIADAAGVLLMPPYFYHYSDTQLFEFYRQFARAIGSQTRIYLYNLPLFTNPISGSLAIRLLGTGAFSGIKDSSGDWRLFETLRDLRDKIPFTLLIGSESIYLRSRSAGADGIVSGVAAAIPELFVAIERAVRSHDCERATRLDAHLEEFTRWIEKFPATVGIKQAAVARGWKLKEFALPPDDDTQAELAGFHHWFRGWLPGVLSECSDAAGKSVG